MLKERGVKVIRDQKISYSIKPAANLAPQSQQIVGVGPDPLLIIGEYGYLEVALINEFEQMPGMRSNPTPCVVGGDPTEAELFPHHWPLVEVSYKILDPLGDVVPPQPRRVSLALRGSRIHYRFRRTTCSVYCFHRPEELLDRRTRPIGIRYL